jgi:hypothetical protein
MLVIRDVAKCAVDGGLVDLNAVSRLGHDRYCLVALDNESAHPSSPMRYRIGRIFITHRGLLVVPSVDVKSDVCESCQSCIVGDPFNTSSVYGFPNVHGLSYPETVESELSGETSV